VPGIRITPNVVLFGCVGVGLFLAAPNFVAQQGTYKAAAEARSAIRAKEQQGAIELEQQKAIAAQRIAESKVGLQYLAGGCHIVRTQGAKGKWFYTPLSVGTTVTDPNTKQFVSDKCVVSQLTVGLTDASGKITKVFQIAKEDEAPYRELIDRK
jgi:hypothetical protein